MNKRVLGFVSCLVMIAMMLSCGKDNEVVSHLLTLSEYSASVSIGEDVAVGVNLSNPSAVSYIDVRKAIAGQIVEDFSDRINVAGSTFPFNYIYQVQPEDAAGVTVCSFYAQDASGQQLDAADLVMEVAIAQIPLLLKYDWQMVSQIIKGEDLAKEYMKDDLFRYNPDLTWEKDWGSVISVDGMETLDATCAWKAVMDGARIDSIYTVKYNIFSPGIPVITGYKVLQCENRKLVLESHQDLSFVAGYDKDERVVETFEAVSQTDDFTPYRGSDPASYFIENCNPGSY